MPLSSAALVEKPLVFPICFGSDLELHHYIFPLEASLTQTHARSDVIKLLTVELSSIQKYCVGNMKGPLSSSSITRLQIEAIQLGKPDRMKTPNETRSSTDYDHGRASKRSTSSSKRSQGVHHCTRGLKTNTSIRHRSWEIKIISKTPISLFRNHAHYLHKAKMEVIWNHFLPFDAKYCVTSFPPDIGCFNCGRKVLLTQMQPRRQRQRSGVYNKMCQAYRNML